MAFTIDIHKDDIFPVIDLRNDEEATFIQVYAFGALLNAFKIADSINLIDGFTSPQDAHDNITNDFKSAKLSPFVCRLNKGKYFFNNQEHTIDKFFLKEEAIHGLLYDAVFTIVDQGANNNAAFATLEYDYSKKDEGFPFSYRCTVNYSLEENNRLVIETSVKNYSYSLMPVSDGWHPYFILGGTINEIFMQINTEKMIEFNEQLIPTGNTLVYKKFQQPEILGETFLDNCFLLNENNRPACILKNNTSGLKLIIHPDRSYPYLQIYTPAHRRSIAIENLSATPDSFNNKIGLKILQPGEICSFKTTYSASLEL
jgi:aldose 1-epimerase